MKKDIHPKYEEATITCACGYVLKTRSTVKNMNVNTCAACHPYFTGQAKFKSLSSDAYEAGDYSVSVVSPGRDGYTSSGYKWIKKNGNDSYNLYAMCGNGLVQIQNAQKSGCSHGTENNAHKKVSGV